jgi:hypothetical protein
LFACLVLKTFFKTDYGGIAYNLTDLAHLHNAPGLRRVLKHHPAQGCRLASPLLPSTPAPIRQATRSDRSDSPASFPAQLAGT